MRERLILNGHLEQRLLSESQCDFNRHRGSIDMIFANRPLQEKCQEIRTHLYTTLVDLTKAIDTLNRAGLRKILQKFGCPERFTHMLRQLHDGMMARVTDNGMISEASAVTNGVKQGCALTTNLFSLLLFAMPMDAYRDERPGIRIAYSGEELLNTRRSRPQGREGQLRTWLETVRRDMEVVLGSAYAVSVACEKKGLRCPGILDIFKHGEEALCKDYLQGVDPKVQMWDILALLDDEVYDLTRLADISMASTPSVVLDGLRKILWSSEHRWVLQSEFQRPSRLEGFPHYGRNSPENSGAAKVCPGVRDPQIQKALLWERLLALALTREEEVLQASFKQPPWSLFDVIAVHLTSPAMPSPKRLGSPSPRAPCPTKAIGVGPRLDVDSSAGFF
ncbi:unnamed protein product [Schistocephalus solidus]|uniref:Reverse transcriptase domain-containing protein n=1 Tax=Schistocephalus solidus TaxID=70667 RepID=A0A183SEK6_SCHSO|nr:unnamed protein product [Schistocephalus solidus]